MRCRVFLSIKDTQSTDYEAYPGTQDGEGTANSITPRQARDSALRTACLYPPGLSLAERHRPAQRDRKPPTGRSTASGSKAAHLPSRHHDNWSRACTYTIARTAPRGALTAVGHLPARSSRACRQRRFGSTSPSPPHPHTVLLLPSMQPFHCETHITLIARAGSIRRFLRLQARFRPETGCSVFTANTDLV